MVGSSSQAPAIEAVSRSVPGSAPAQEMVDPGSSKVDPDIPRGVRPEHKRPEPILDKADLARREPLQGHAQRPDGEADGHRAEWLDEGQQKAMVRNELALSRPGVRLDS